MIQRFLVRGRVQGVGYRWFVARHARKLGLGGYVRNLGDGRVEVVASGDGGALDELVRQLSVGPSGSRVDAVEPEPPSEEALSGAFEIR